ncbi:D-alanyl-D-alanine carboxypeptidase family protein [Tolypothrix sp. FACHB-123]|uniref:D-alanyl-D-alanine carboxypeptidase family protein n=1 Tax=Tolypothrix sp. FACHB-123 TaxID=2692868 RepID=UPI00168928AC|nr:D-alanyl-D-alanine carboxypeptidase family protein [Tolypothrix sp. FACHB-123]MBD2353053.1 D-alanyl-D-alanine carboxypeptidase family protein [Tolypothrix sp. FACHB-123]
MYRIFHKLTLLTIIFLITFTLVASNGIAHHQTVIHTAQFNICLNNAQCLISPEPITSPTPIKPFTPNPELNEQQRFLSAIAMKLPTIPQPGTYEYILLHKYGAVFVNQEPEIKLPKKVILANEQETKEFQSTLAMIKINGTKDCYLQQAAGLALNKAKTIQKIPLKSGYGSGDCTRTFSTNLRFWQKYANKRTLEKVRQGKETAILSIVAPPGTSQHLWGLAIDLRLSSQKQRQALNQNGWFQTVEGDTPHWTYLGLTESQLPQFGFQKKLIRGITYWITPIY